MSQLMFDWNDPKRDFYELDRKIEKTEFLKIFKIAEGKCYALNCLRIIYQYFYESEVVYGQLKDCFSFEYWRIESEENIDDNVSEYDNIPVSNVSSATSKKRIEENSFFITELFKVIVIFWSLTTDNKADYEEKKNNVYKVIEESEKIFFDLAFLLHENSIKKFQDQLEKYLEKLKSEVGEYYKNFATPNLRLLITLMKRKELNSTLNFVVKKCSYVEYNCTILTTFEEAQEFQKIILNKFKNSNFERMVSDQLLFFKRIVFTICYKFISL